MTRLRVLALPATIAVGLLGAGVWAQGTEQNVTRRFTVTLDGQIAADEPDPATRLAPNETAAVLSGEDVGFRLDGVDSRKGTVTGTLVVKVNGEWYEVTSPLGLMPAGR
jgi:hypothetical protein